MKRLLTVLSLATCLMAWSAAAADEPASKPKPTPEQKQFRKEMIAKYDTNGDGKLDKEERAKMSPEEKQKMKEMSGQKPKKDKPAGE
jgi:hypothetical protein